MPWKFTVIANRPERITAYRTTIDGRRHRLHYNDLEKAIAEAEAKAAQLSRCDGAAATFSGRDRHIYERALQEIKDFDVPLDAAAHEYKEERKLLDGVPLVDAAPVLFPTHRLCSWTASRVRVEAPDALQKLDGKDAERGPERRATPSPGGFPTQHSREDGFSGLIFERMTDIEVGFAGHSDDRRISDVQLLSRASVKREIAYVSN
jgi:hypothetical protein